MFLIGLLLDPCRLGLVSETRPSFAFSFSFFEGALFSNARESLKDTSVLFRDIYSSSFFPLHRFYCLHPRGYLYDGTSLGPRDDALDFIKYCYYTGELDDNGNIERGSNVSSLGLGDFLFYNLMLLWILPPLSSVTTQACVAIGHIITFQIGETIAAELATLHGCGSCPALPLPIVAVSFYASVLDMFIA